MLSPIVHIILPIYNGEKYILDQLMSIYMQEYKNYFLYIINDASTDNSVDIINKFIADYNLNDKVKLYHNKENLNVNYTIEKGLNIVLEKCKKDDLVCFCDADDIWTYNKLSTQVAFMDTHKNCDLSYHDLALINENNVITHMSHLQSIHTRLNNIYDNSFPEFCTNQHISTTSIMFRCIYIQDLLPFSNALSQDHWTVLVLSFLGRKFIQIPQTLAYYRKHTNSRLTLRTKNYDPVVGFSKRLSALEDLYHKFPDPNITLYQNYFVDRIKWQKKGLRFRYQLLLIAYYHPNIFFLFIKKYSKYFFSRYFKKI